jgi:hypothetical protein
MDERRKSRIDECLAHEKQRDCHQQTDVPADGLNGKEHIAQALEQRQREQDDPQESAQCQPKRNCIRSVLDQAHAATQPVQWSPEQGEVLKAFVLFHDFMWSVEDPRPLRYDLLFVLLYAKRRPGRPEE